MSHKTNRFSTEVQSWLESSGYAYTGGNAEFHAFESSIQTITAATYTVTYEDRVILVDASSNAVTISLLSGPQEGVSYYIKAIDITNTVTLDTADAATIDGNASIVFSTQYDCYLVISDGTNWHIL